MNEQWKCGAYKLILVSRKAKGNHKICREIKIAKNNYIEWGKTMPKKANGSFLLFFEHPCSDSVDVNI